MSDISNLLALSQAQHLAGNLKIAAQGYSAVLAADPERAEAWHLSGLLAHQTGHSEEALLYLQRAIELDAGNPEFYCNLSAITLALGAADTAEQAADVALALEPLSPTGAFRKGVALAARGQSQQAVEFLQAALDRDFDPIATLLELGTVLQAVGNFAEAIHAFEVSLELNPDQPSVYFQLSKMVSTGDYQFRTEHIAKLESLLRRAGQGEAVASGANRICFALATHWEKLQLPARALEYYDLGNQVTKIQLAGKWNSRLQQRAVAIEGLKKYFTPERLKSWEGWGHPSERPIFVLGVPRSGTTLVEQILSSHPQVEDGGELTALEEVLVRWQECWLRPEAAGDLSREAVWEAAEDYLQRLRTVNDTAEFVVDKMPVNSQYIGFIRLLFPKARIVYCRRDPRDIGASCFSTLFNSDRLKFETSSWELIGQSFQLHREVMRHWTTLYGPTVTEVFYELLTAQPEQAIRHLLQSLGLSWSDACLQHSKRSATVKTASSVQVRKAIYQTSRERWRRFLPGIQPLLESLGSTIAEFEADLANACLASDSQTSSQNQTVPTEPTKNASAA
jgi:tetratricopeptide (TPR) repeat protein